MSFLENSFYIFFISIKLYRLNKNYLHYYYYLVTLLATLSQRDSKNFFKFKIILFGDTFWSIPIWWHFLRIPFWKKNIDQKKKQPPYLVTLFLVTLLRHLRLPKIDFKTFQLGITQLVLWVRGQSGSHPPIFLLPFNYYYLVTLFVTLSTASDN